MYEMLKLKAQSTRDIKVIEASLTLTCNPFLSMNGSLKLDPCPVSLKLNASHSVVKMKAREGARAFCSCEQESFLSTQPAFDWNLTIFFFF